MTSYFDIVQIRMFGVEEEQEGHLRGGKGLFKWLQMIQSINLSYALRPLQINFTPVASRLIMWQRAGDVPGLSGPRKRQTPRQIGTQSQSGR